jgi:hypothetical protein
LPTFDCGFRFFGHVCAFDGWRSNSNREM